MSTTHPERTWTGPGAPERLAILRRTRSIAIVGASDKPARASYFVATYLLSSTTYDVYFVNPVLAAAGKEILGHRVYASLDDLPVIPDLVEVFRKSSDAPEVVADAAHVGARTVWLQLGIWNEDAARQAEAAKVTNSAAMPDAVATAPIPPSSVATRSSNAATVGLPIRE